MPTIGRIDYLGDEAEGFTPPSGTYDINISATKVFTAKDNPRNIFAILVMDILSGEHQGKSHEEMFIVQHEKRQAAAMGHAKLRKNICEPLKIAFSDVMDETDILIGNQLSVTIVTKGDKNGVLRANITLGKPYGEAEQGQSGKEEQDDEVPF